MILVLIDKIVGDCKIKGFEDHFSVESFSFGVERELAESGKSGTADINIGVGELQECSMSKSMDSASVYLARKAISGSSLGTTEIKFVEAGEGKDNKQFNVIYLWFKLDNTFVKSWSISGDADDRPTEDVALWYNKIGFRYFSTEDGITYKNAGECAWDNVTSKAWGGHAIPDSEDKVKIAV